MANTLSTHTLRQVYMKGTLEVALRNSLVCEKICMVDRRDKVKTIENPYITQQTAAIQAVAGTYSVSAMTTTDDTLTVADEVIFGTHIHDFEERTSNFDLITSFFDDLAYSVAFKVDQFVLNVITEDGTGTYTTPAGGFTTQANIPVIMSNLLSKVAGYQGVNGGLFLVIENTDVVGFAQAQVASGFSYADAALNNGFMSSYMGVDIYVVRSGTFVSTTLGTRADLTNSGHRVFGVKNVCTYATPRGFRYEEKGVSGKTGKEIVVSMLVGAKVWTPKASLIVDITLA